MYLENQSVSDIGLPEFHVRDSSSSWLLPVTPGHSLSALQDHCITCAFLVSQLPWQWNGSNILQWKFICACYSICWKCFPVAWIYFLHIVNRCCVTHDSSLDIHDTSRWITCESCSSVSGFVHWTLFFKYPNLPKIQVTQMKSGYWITWLQWICNFF
jgi:hypothetical protein